MPRNPTTIEEIQKGDDLLVDLDYEHGKPLQELQNKVNNIENLSFANLLTLPCLLTQTTKGKEPLVDYYNPMWSQLMTIQESYEKGHGKGNNKPNQG